MSSLSTASSNVFLMAKEEEAKTCASESFLRGEELTWLSFGFQVSFCALLFSST